MRAATTLAMLLVACGAHDEAPSSAPAPAPPSTLASDAPDTGPPTASPLDGLVDWIVANDVESLRGAPSSAIVALTTPDGGALCVVERCFDVPSIAAVHAASAWGLEATTRADPSLVTTFTVRVEDEPATLIASSTRDASIAIGARPPARTRSVQGETELAPRDASAIEGLDDALAPLGEVGDVRVQTLRSGSRRITLITVSGDGEPRSTLLVRGPDGVSRAPEGASSATLYEVVGAGLAGAFTVVRVREPDGRGWSSALWSVSTEGGQAHVEPLSLGGVDGYGEACDDEHDGYCVWLTACERDLVVDDATHAHLGPPLTWSAEHRRAPDRWSYGVPDAPQCPPSEVVVGPRGLTAPRSRRRRPRRTARLRDARMLL